ncbi:ABC transporter substrate-binding protein [Jiangella asiatica]|uniref:ABC transporter substrate-binding protein n=1 Tax=Jiangella asiatica TaxID=2530372 RepID=UPI0013A5EFA9|nr:ABC transporter substrate-binding protein [Jiangella asiatica]
MGIGIAGTSMASILSACQDSSGGPAGDSLRAKTVMFDITTGRVDSPELFNPLVPGVNIQQGLHQAVLEPLFILNHETEEVEPWLGESFEPNDTLDVWTLTLREGALWSDGEAFDADDVVFTIDLLRNGPAELLHSAPMKQWVQSVTAVDPRTVEFQLVGPNPRFQLDYFSVKITNSVPILPAHIWQGQDPLTFTNFDKERSWPVFTGPYRLTKASPTEFIYERRSDWWAAETGVMKLPEPERLVWVANETEEVRVARIADHQLDSVADITAGAFISLQTRNEYAAAWVDEEPYSWVDPCVRLLSFNHTVQPWNDRELRWAVNHAIDRDEIVAIAYEGATTPARFFFPSYPQLDKYVDLLESEGLFEEYPLLEHNPDRAIEILERKGYTKNGEFYEKDGQPLQLRIDTPSEITEIKRIAQVIVEQLRRVGINATSNGLAYATWSDNVANGQYEAVTDWGACGSVSEPWSSMQLYHPRWVVAPGQRANGNVVRWTNQQYGENVDRFAELPLDDPQIETHVVAAARAWLDDLPFIPIAQAKKLVPFDSYYWEGWPSQSNNYVQPPTWWQSTHKILQNLTPANR